MFKGLDSTDLLPESIANLGQNHLQPSAKELIEAIEPTALSLELAVI